MPRGGVPKAACVVRGHRGIAARETDRERLRKVAVEMRHQGLTQEEVAAKLGVSDATISNWKSQNSTQAIPVLELLASPSPPTSGFVSRVSFRRGRPPAAEAFRRTPVASSLSRRRRTALG
jgi:transcriptional regulator with XRE-family HTH domain